MSTAANVAARQSLSDTQLKANRSAIKRYLAEKTAMYGKGETILLPEFVEDPTGAWVPVQGNGARIQPGTNGKEVAFMRLGIMGIADNGKPTPVYTNVFGDDADDIETRLILLGAKVGEPIDGVRICVHESVEPFSRTNPSRDLKKTPDGIQLVKYVPNAQGEAVATPIYRRVIAHFADTNGEFRPTAKSTYVEHDNKQQLSDAWFARQKANTGAITSAAPTSQLTEEQELEQLQAIPKAKRTAEQKARIAELA